MDTQRLEAGRRSWQHAAGVAIALLILTSPATGADTRFRPNLKLSGSLSLPDSEMTLEVPAGATGRQLATRAEERNSALSAAPEQIDIHQPFGATLFDSVADADSPATSGPGSRVSPGDVVHIRYPAALGGLSQRTTVDTNGLLYVDQRGPIQVAGLSEPELRDAVASAMGDADGKRGEAPNVSLESRGSIGVTVAGGVVRTGTYVGAKDADVLHYLRAAGGIDPDHGSYRRIDVRRRGHLIQSLDLYDLLMKGHLPRVRLESNDILFVHTPLHRVSVKGLARNTRRFEFLSAEITLQDLIDLAQPDSSATQAVVATPKGIGYDEQSYPLEGAKAIRVQAGAIVSFTGDAVFGNIAVQVEAGQALTKDLVLPYGATIGDLRGRLNTFKRISGTHHIEVFRRDVRAAQASALRQSTDMLNDWLATSIDRLAQRDMQMAQRFQKQLVAAQPLGQLLISDRRSQDDLPLADGDLIRLVPGRAPVWVLGGELPSPVVIDFLPNQGANWYVTYAKAAPTGYADLRTVVISPNGIVETPSENGPWPPLDGGEKVLLLPRVQTESDELGRLLERLQYQVAVTAHVVLASQ